MDKETVRYIIDYFSNLMTDDEMLALKYHIYTQKTEEDSKMRKTMVERGWINDTPEVKQFLKDGYEKFELITAQRMMQDSSDKIFLNRCEKCRKLARTPFAKQCRYCGYDWHDLKITETKNI